MARTRPRRAVLAWGAIRIFSLPADAGAGSDLVPHPWLSEAPLTLRLMGTDRQGGILEGIEWLESDRREATGSIERRLVNRGTIGLGTLFKGEERVPTAEPHPHHTTERFRQGAPKGNALTLISAMWDGFCLRCPSCRKGAMLRDVNSHPYGMPWCGAPFERDNEGDFLGAMVTAYSLAVVLRRHPHCPSLCIHDAPRRHTDDDHRRHLSPVYSLFFYRNLKGVWIAVLLALLRWFR